MSGIDREIDLLKLAHERLDQRMREDFPVHPGECCAQCKYGHEYVAVADKLERQAAWLRILLAKRGRLEDLDLAEAIRVSAWP